MLPSKEFPFEMGVAYSLELFLQLIPNLFCQVFNNAETPGDLTKIQSAALAMKLICLILMVTELSVMIWEVANNRDLKKLKIVGFEKLSEEERREKNHKKAITLATASMALFIAFVVLASVFGEGRKCGDRQALENAVCSDCWSPYCQECPGSSSVTGCQKCDPGYLLRDGDCVKCDGETSYNKCLDCVVSTTEYEQTVCTRCAEGNLLNVANGFHKECEGCSVTANCAKCTKDTCEKCKEGFRLYKGKCEPCSDIPHCVKCSSSDTTKCDVCDYHVADLDSNGKCSKCRTDMGWKPDGKGGCKCNDIVNSLDGNKCLKCDQLIPGCKACGPATKNSLLGNAISVQIGYDPLLSDQSEAATYIQCVGCGPGMFAGSDKTCKYCRDLIPGCKTC